MDEKAELSVLLCEAGLIFFNTRFCKIAFSGWGRGAGNWMGEKREPLS